MDFPQYYGSWVKKDYMIDDKDLTVRSFFDKTRDIILHRDSRS